MKLTLKKKILHRVAVEMREKKTEVTAGENRQNGGDREMR